MCTETKYTEMISVILLPSLRDAATQGHWGVVSAGTLTRFTCRNWLNWPFRCLLSHGIRTSCFLTEMGLTLLIPHHSPNLHFVLFLSARVEVRALHVVTKHVLYTYEPSDHGLLLNNWLTLFQPFSSPPALERQESSKTVTTVQNQNFPKDWAVIILLSLT